MIREDELEVLPGVPWGNPDDAFSPAFWARVGIAATDADGFTNVRSSLRREICFCLLGGYGIKAEINKAAFVRLSRAGIFKLGRTPRSREIEKLLRLPLMIGKRKIRYRFPHQRAVRLAAALRLLEKEAPPQDAIELRQWLMQIPGIGFKTASWIVRNHFASDAVAILDVHIVRACQLMNLFAPEIQLPRDYIKLEQKFLNFAKAIGVRPSLLDAVMWREMRTRNLRVNSQ